MEELRDLNILYNEANQRFLQYDGKDFVLPDFFKNEVKEINSNCITYNKYSAVIETRGNQNGGLHIFLPNQWFYIASYFTDLYNELQKYKEAALLITSKERLKILNGKELNENEIRKLNNLSLSDESKERLVKFITDYSWWSGAKTIDRADFYVSPILNSARLVNASQSFVADLCAYLSDKSDLVASIINDNNLVNDDLGIPPAHLGNLQQIFYGAPGTGKSFKTNEVAQKYSTIRTTFHPDSDYSTFVGAYKPTTVKQVRYGLNGSTTVPLKYPDGKNKDNQISESKIEYRFVKQAFLKAYIEAWKKYTSQKNVNPIHHYFYVSSGIDLWILLKVDDSKVYYKKESRLSKDFYEAAVKKAWGTKLNKNNYHQLTACSWYDNNSADEEKTAESCWNAVWKELNTGRTIKSKPGSQQEYSISLEGDSIVVTAEGKGDGKGASQDTIKKHFYSNDNDSDSSVQKAIAQKLKEYGEDFDKSWSQLKEEVEESQVPNTVSSEHQMVQPQFLIIEEINRGNCAQIFGDLFQLLDRKKGYSEYPIDADEDICKSLVSEDTDEDPSFGETGLQFTDEQKNAINAIYKKEGVPFRDVADEIAKGKILVLPPNLYIWATMNTSDQSLFPIDSAFKRRWDWKYIPISEGKEKWSIVVKDNEYDWWTFLKKMNSVVGEATMSEDKKMGFYFCKADDKKHINADTFVSKVMFYLWNDVFKDNGLDWKNEKGEPIFKYKVKDKDANEKEEDMVFSTFFKEDGTSDEDQVERLMKNMLINPNAKAQ